jgi:catalase
MHRMLVNKGAASYEPNSITSGVEFRVDGGQQGFQSHGDAMEGQKIRRRSASFDDHFTQATLFWNSQGAAEREHLVAAFQFELSKVEVPAIRQRMIDNLAHVDPKLARKVAEPLGIAAPDAKAAAGRAGFRDVRIKLPLESSPSLSMETNGALNGSAVATRRVAVLVANGVEVGALRVIQQALQDAGAACRIVGAQLGFVATSSGQQLGVNHTFANMPSVMFDAVLVPGGAASAQALGVNGDAVHFMLEAYKHCKPICVIGEGVQLLRTLGVGVEQAGAAAIPGVVVGRNDPPGRAQLAQDFIAALARHRHWTRPKVEAVPA